jgi:hypothetical protein
MEMTQVPRYASISEIAEIYRLDRISLYSRPNLPGEVRTGKRRLIDVNEFDRAVRAGEIGEIPTGKKPVEVV